jgi:hypothetical protein
MGIPFQVHDGSGAIQDSAAWSACHIPPPTDRCAQGRGVTQAKVAKLQGHYDTIWWFAPPPVYHHLERLTIEAQWEQVRVLPLPTLAERTET